MSNQIDWGNDYEKLVDLARELAGGFEIQYAEIDESTSILFWSQGEPDFYIKRCASINEFIKSCKKYYKDLENQRKTK